MSDSRTDRLMQHLAALLRHDKVLDAQGRPTGRRRLRAGAAEAVIGVLGKEGIQLVVENGTCVCRGDRVPVEVRRFVQEEQEGFLRYDKIKGRLRAARQVADEVPNTNRRLNVRAQRRLLGGYMSAGNSDSSSRYLSELMGVIDELPLSAKDKTTLRVYFEPGEEIQPDLARERRFGNILKRLRRHKGRGRPAARRFLQLVALAWAGGVSMATSRIAYPVSMDILRRRFEAGDRAALGAALAAEDGENPIEDPATIHEVWVRKALLSIAREHLPLKGRGRTTSKTPEEARSDNRDAVSLSNAVKRLSLQYEARRRAGDTHATARKQVEDDFKKTTRVKDPRRKRILLEFGRRMTLKERSAVR